METTMRSVKMSTILKQARRKARARNSPHLRRNIFLVSRCLKAWGDTEVFEKKELRHLTAKSVSMRLGLPYDYVRNRFDQLHRIAEYDAVNREGRERLRIGLITHSESIEA